MHPRNEWVKVRVIYTNSTNTLIHLIFFTIPALRDQYYMVKKIGGGSFGTVYVVQHKSSGEHFAAKHQVLKEPGDRRYSHREVEVLARVAQSRQIVQLIDYFESDKQSVIVSEYVSGGG